MKVITSQFKIGLTQNKRGIDYLIGKKTSEIYEEYLKGAKQFPGEPIKQRTFYEQSISYFPILKSSNHYYTKKSKDEYQKGLEKYQYKLDKLRGEDD